MYTIENNLLHLHLGCHPKWDFCHHKWDSKIPSGVADFSYEFLQKLNQITVKRGGHRGAEFQIQSLHHFVFVTLLRPDFSFLLHPFLFSSSSSLNLVEKSNLIPSP